MSKPFVFATQGASPDRYLRDTRQTVGTPQSGQGGRGARPGGDTFDPPTHDWSSAARGDAPPSPVEVLRPRTGIHPMVRPHLPYESLRPVDAVLAARGVALEAVRDSPDPAMVVFLQRLGPHLLAVSLKDLSAAQPLDVVARALVLQALVYSEKQGTIAQEELAKEADANILTLAAFVESAPHLGRKLIGILANYPETKLLTALRGGEEEQQALRQAHYPFNLRERERALLEALLLSHGLRPNVAAQLSMLQVDPRFQFNVDVASHPPRRWSLLAVNLTPERISRALSLEEPPLDPEIRAYLDSYFPRPRRRRGVGAAARREPVGAAEQPTPSETIERISSGLVRIGEVTQDLIYRLRAAMDAVDPETPFLGKLQSFEAFTQALLTEIEHLQEAEAHLPHTVPGTRKFRSAASLVVYKLEAVLREAQPYLAAIEAP